MNPVASSSQAARTPRAGSQSRSGASTLAGEPKISEENGVLPGGADGIELSDEDLHDDEETGLTSRDRRRKQKKRTYARYRWAARRAVLRRAP